MKVEYNYDTPELFLRALQDRPRKPGACSSVKGSDQQPHNKSWCDLPTVEAAIAKAATGDPETARLIVPRNAELAQHSAMNTVVYDYAGDNVDVGRYLSGEPECMASLRKKGKPIINILVNITVAHYVTRQAIINRGKAILEIMSGLESNGYGVDITIVNIVKGCRDSDLHTVTVKVKDSKEYFNLHSLAFWLVSPSAFRRLWFRFIEQEDSKIQNNIGPCYGAVKDVPKKILDTMSACVYFPILRDNYSNYGDVIKNILEEFKA